ncbi:hypothetical protein CIL05_05175 [Virgibacillus profundi]|uniref:DUF4870 domain-containing protein n=1 Tax=Virgibacillus profundi TaxID=2024555 RepID=A0A2A2IFS0_9BACI|nr:DUF4870 domain-containing protein [Virgibacillus profundi]PAV30497.1 hypothetical protein CIL05_05175 [Virgibacillus profundi]PXY54669.1 DUF4870 domain-containing protein [Virgibacillus profundi]
MRTEDERLFSMLIYILSLPFPVLGPLVIWLLKREESEFVDYHGKEYFNFIVSYIIYGIISSILIILLVGILMLIVLSIMTVVFTIIAAVKSYQGERYRFPLVIHFIK